MRILKINLILKIFKENNNNDKKKPIQSRILNINQY